MKATRWIFFGVMLALLTGCNQMLAERMVAPPNLRNATDAPPAACNTVVNGVRKIVLPVGPPKAMLSAWVLEPPAGKPVCGTVLVLHGIIVNHDWVRSAAENFRTAGFRAVLVDLRGHGASTGDHITYGVVESQDLKQLTDYLQQNKLCGDTLGVYGVSYGAATAIQYAAIEPRVTAVVAVAAFATLREEAPNFGRHILPIPGLFLADADYADVVTRAGKIANFDPDAASPLAAIQKTKAHVLLIHGDLDLVTSVECSKRLHAAAPENSELQILAGQGHALATLNVDPKVLEAAQKWLLRHAALIGIPFPASK